MCWSLELRFPSAHVSAPCLWNLVCRRAACSFLERHPNYGVISAVDSLSFDSSLQQPLQIPDLLPCLFMASLTSVMQVLMVCQFMPQAARKGPVCWCCTDLCSPCWAAKTSWVSLCAWQSQWQVQHVSMTQEDSVAWPALAFGCMKRNELGDREEEVGAGIVWVSKTCWPVEACPAVGRCYGGPPLTLTVTALVGSSATSL